MTLTREMISLAPMLGLLACAAALDARLRRIPNWLTASLAATGLAQTQWGGSITFMQSALGLLAGFGLTFILFTLGALAGGDVKLFAGIGAWLGAVAVVQVFALQALLGMLFVIGQALWNRRMVSLCRNSAVIVMNAAGGDLTCPPQPTDDKMRLPYAVPTFIASVVVLLVKGRSI